MLNPGRPTAVRTLVRRGVLLAAVVAAAVTAWVVGSPPKPDAQAGGMEAGRARVVFDASGAARVGWDGGTVEVSATAGGTGPSVRERWMEALRPAGDAALPAGRERMLEVVAPPETPWGRVRDLLDAGEPAFRLARLSIDGRTWQGLVLVRPRMEWAWVNWCPGPGGPDDMPYEGGPRVANVTVRLTRGGSDGPPDGWILVTVDENDTVHVPPVVGGGDESYSAIRREVRRRVAVASDRGEEVFGGEVEVPVPRGDGVPLHVVVGTLAAIRPVLASLVLLLPRDEGPGGVPPK